MFKPFEIAFLTIEDVCKLLSFIENTTKTKKLTNNYEKMANLGILDIYRQLSDFKEGYYHYKDEVLNYHAVDFQRNESYYE